jgi:RNA polymerase sigma-70 factor, ECF subfamily
MQPGAEGFVRRRRCGGRAGRVQCKPMDLEDDGELMLRYARGDLRAFEALYKRHRSGLYRYLSRHTRNPESANDLFQEVWSKVIASRERYEPRAKFQTFLYRIAHNCFVDYCRRAAVRAEISGDAQEDWQSSLPAPDDDRPDARAEQAQALARYRAALAALPAEQRDVFLLYEESGLSLEEIAVITAVGQETAKSRLRYAVSKLRQSLSSTAPAGTALGAPCAAVEVAVKITRERGQ